MKIEALLYKESADAPMQAEISELVEPIAGITLDDKKLDAWEDSLGFEYNDFLCDCLGPWDAVVPFSLAYVVSERVSTCGVVRSG